MKRNVDFMWSLSLFGTAIGAGILFLPIQTGISGIIPILVVLVFIFPMVFLSHRALCRFVISNPNTDSDITVVADDYFGKFGGIIFNVLYLFAILPILLVYSVGITNTLVSFFKYPLHYDIQNRFLLSFFTILSLVFIINFGQKLIIRVMSFLVFPFIIALLVLSLWMIPYWNINILRNSFEYNHSFSGILLAIWIIMPILIFSFNHSPIISSLAVYAKIKYKQDADKKASRIIAFSNILMIVTVVIFVFSSMLTLSPDDLIAAKEENVSILSYLASHFDDYSLDYIAPLVAIVAMSKSFFGHYLGSKEGIDGIICKISKNSISQKTIKPITLSIVFLSCWLVAYLNPNILDMISSIGGLILAVILFIMPIYSIYKIKYLKQYKNLLADSFILFVGIVALSSAIYVLF
ncbi:aromatic amino acid transport family protein [Francisella orientalis]|uniref:Serine transporter n=1 Tax=Francisella orientalis TaxID=299583 RepID=A0AAP7FY28_9GAMM|nr:aromatic amino acid transport family protein [Francisella orientalis]AFJ42585.1 serine permease [Francisella orientalis str. Toba 04]AHB97748.1 serine/threonine transporter [Francisella orientalis LADL 07-285A]AKN84835.1 Serine transporter [Francisella orientalis FNO12]AKN86373.1 Serine transporter [Francisella orientalis FNO24]AKN87911.1 Serine transporter [Francisella orientalis]